MSENKGRLSLSLPDQKDYEIAYNLAIHLAAEKLASPEVFEEQCRRSDSVCRTNSVSRIISLNYLNREYQITLPEISISLTDSDKTVELRDQILILHYITQARGTPLSNSLISYQELKEGSVYYPNFVQRAVKPLVDYFGKNPERLLNVSKELNGHKADFGDIAVTIQAFPRVPVTLVIWKGDAEFPPDASILFDNTILDYLTAEDVNVLCQSTVWYLVKALQSNSSTSQKQENGN
jgi:hypothetical protein